MTQVRRKLSLVLWTLLVMATVSASGQDLEKTLNAQYKDKILALRHPRQVNKQEYDASGAVVGDNSEGPWTLYGRIRVKQIQVKADQMEIEGKRVPYSPDNETHQLAPSKDGEKARLTIRLDKPPASANEATEILGRVFALSNEELVKSAPEYWRHYLEVKLGLAPDDRRVTDPQAKNARRAPDKPMEKLGNDGEGVFTVGEGTLPPKVTYQPEPEFSEEARKAQFQGTVGVDMVVDGMGVVRRIQIVRPAGMGLDEKAVQGISAWRFQPATRQGQPVAVVLYVEVQFALYKGR